MQVYSQPRVRELQRLLNGTDNRGVGPGCEVSERGRFILHNCIAFCCATGANTLQCT